MLHHIARLALLTAITVFVKFNLRAAELPFTVKVSGKGSPVIFIPGYTCGGAVWDATVTKFSPEHECHVLTIRGFGGEPAAVQPFTLADVKNGIKTYITEKKLKNVLIAGHSMGGFLAMWVATEMQQPQLAGIVIVDALPFMAALADSTAQERSFDSTSAAQLETMLKSQSYEMRKQQGKPMAAYYCSDSTFHLQIAEWSAVSDPHTSARLIMDMSGTDLRDDIAKIKVPVLALTAWEPGYNVPVESIRSTWAKQYAAVPNFTLKMVTPSRHFIMYDAPEVFYSELNTFIAKTVPAAK
ncbi:MAG: alpha/beta fold hydrolase [Bacteroidia bacterium]